MYYSKVCIYVAIATILRNKQEGTRPRWAKSGVHINGYIVTCTWDWPGSLLHTCTPGALTVPRTIISTPELRLKNSGVLTRIVRASPYDRGGTLLCVERTSAHGTPQPHISPVLVTLRINSMHANRLIFNLSGKATDSIVDTLAIASGWSWRASLAKGGRQLDGAEWALYTPSWRLPVRHHHCAGADLFILRTI